MDREYGAGVRGAKSAMAKRLDKQPDYISRCLYPPDKPGRKNIGEDFAREIENAYGLNRYDLDRSANDGGLVEIDKTPEIPKIDTENFKPDARYKTNGFWSVDIYLDHLRKEPTKQKRDLLQSLRNEIVHGSDSRSKDRHRLQKILYVICTAAADQALTDVEYSILESAVVCIGARYEVLELESKLNEIKKAGNTA